METYFQLFFRETKVAVKRWTDVLTGIILFFLTAILFPLISDSGKDFLLSIVGPIMMFSSFFASLLSMQNMFKADFQNGTIEQLAFYIFTSYSGFRFDCFDLFRDRQRHFNHTDDTFSLNDDNDKYQCFHCCNHTWY